MLRSYLTRFQSAPTLANLAAITLFFAVLAWWATVFHARLPEAPARPVPPAAIDISAGGTLFGAQPDQGSHDQVQLLGVLAFDRNHAAAVISVGGAEARVVRLNGPVADSTTLREVHARSIVVEHNGIQREISLPAAQDPSVFMR